MKNRLLATANVLLLALLTTLLVVPAPVATALPGDGVTTEDILHMADGRELHGRIVEEKGDAVVFEVVMRGSSIRSKVTFLLEEIVEIERDVPLADAPEAARPERAPRGATSRPDDEPEATYGARRAASDDEDVTSFYVVPMKGQMGTDVRTDVYRDMIKDIRAHDPDILVIVMECADNEDVLYSLIGREEQGLADFDEFRELINLFRDELSDIRQVMWVHDSVGVSSVVALVWKDMYMTPDARLGGLVALQQIGFEKWSDDDVRGKMTAAFMSWVKGFLEYGGYPLELADAMVRPTFMLSGTWKGRDVVWSLDTNGDYVVDNDEEKTAEFRAKSAEDLCISSGTAENLDDLALLLGYREYRVLEGKGEDTHEKYKDSWRRSLESCVTWLKDYEQFMGWAGGDDTLKYLGQAKGRLLKVIAAMERYGAVETRLRIEYDVKKFDLETAVEQINEQIRALRQSGRGGRGGAGG